MARDKEEEEEDRPVNFRESRLLTVDQVKVSKSTRILSFIAQSMNNKFQKIRDITQTIKTHVLGDTRNVRTAVQTIPSGDIASLT